MLVADINDCLHVGKHGLWGLRSNRTSRRIDRESGILVRVSDFEFCVLLAVLGNLQLQTHGGRMFCLATFGMYMVSVQIIKIKDCNQIGSINYYYN